MFTSESKISRETGKEEMSFVQNGGKFGRVARRQHWSITRNCKSCTTQKLYCRKRKFFFNEDEQLLRLKSSKTKKETLFWSWKKCKVQRMAATAEDKPWGWITCLRVYFSNIWCSISFYNSWNSKKFGQLYHMSVISVRKLVFLCQPSQCTVAEMEWACTFHVDQSISRLIKNCKEQVHPLNRSLNFD